MFDKGKTELGSQSGDSNTRSGDLIQLSVATKKSLKKNF